MEENKDIKPVIIEEQTVWLRETVQNYFPEEASDNTIADDDMRKAEIIRKMKEDSDIRDYPQMLNLLLVLLLVSTLLWALIGKSFIPVSVLLAGILFRLFITYRLKTAVQDLNQHRENFGRYIWDGYYIKTFRHNATKLSYLIFFPFVMYYSALIIFGSDNINIWLALGTAILISTPVWLFVFNDDRQNLKILKKDLLEVLSYDPENPGF